MKFTNIANFVMVMTAALCAVACLGCQQAATDTADEKAVSSSGEEATDGKLPVLSLATSEYPSWVTFIVAGKMNWLNPEEGGEYGEFEKKHGVDIVLKVTDYDTCLNYYASGQVDAVCMTNADALISALNRPGTAIMPTSTSDGADNVIAVGVDDIEGLKDTPIYLLTKSVSQLVVHEGLKAKGFDPKDFELANLDPGAAAQAIQNPDGQVKAICVWNPFALTVLKNMENAKSLFSSEDTPGLIVDMVVVADSSLEKEGGENFAKALCDIQYKVCEAIANPATRNETVVALGEDFSNLPYEDMETCLKQTKFYMTAQDGTSLFSSSEFQDKMKEVIAACGEIEMLESKGDQVNAPTLSYDGSDAQLKFTIDYMSAVK